ncbi:hypothetical protein [Catellicoccus marimammalium]|uniref:Uncharacterized protein n=1 Tax=Catellicoccus marimammalium M35/04/3 TaxID=1234409 RepID=K8ZL57_9ENTE|nr:hypothetical protein [Catellicoccus marimammalium]EKU27308.1 hypothetical protein C683_0639 [Catellicoccus marimammalium M35/04/3]
MENNILILNLSNDINDFDKRMYFLGGQSNNEIEDELKKVNFPTEKQKKRIRSWEEAFDSHERFTQYYITFGEEIYSSNILNKLSSSIKSDNHDYIPCLDELCSCFKTTMLVIYIKDNEAFIFEESIKNIYLSNKKILFSKEKWQEQNSYRLKAIDEIISLPVDRKKCIASIDFDEERFYIYNSYAFDDCFNLSESQKISAKNNIQKFRDSIYKIANDQVKVIIDIDIDNEEKFNNLIESDSKIYDPLSKYTNNRKRKINSIDIERVKSVIDYLNEYVKKIENTPFTKDKVPIFNNGELIVTLNSLPIFAALLDNKIIVSLLEGKVKIPYYNN